MKPYSTAKYFNNTTQRYHTKIKRQNRKIKMQFILLKKKFSNFLHDLMKFKKFISLFINKNEQEK